MPDPSLDAETDQFLAALRDNLAGVPDGALIPRSIANPLRSQFPGTPELGRILVAACQALRGLAETGAGQGVPLGADQLMLALAFAGAILDQEEAQSRD